jgi:uncharacterized protein
MMRAPSSVRAYLLFALFLSFRVIAGDAIAGERDAGLVRIEATEVVESPFGNIVLLKARNKAIPIFVDAVVAQSIHGALTGEKYPRPLSHDLMHAILQGFNGRVSRVVISLKGATYYADLTVTISDTSKVFDSRSSDAIALAIHFNAPMLVSERLLEEAGKSLDQPAVPTPGERRL